MINTITGKIVAHNDGATTINVAGIGFAVGVPTSMKVAVGQDMTMHIHMHWNQENGPSLYGFANEMDKTVFLLIISCSGIGPKIAMAALAQLGGAGFVAAVQEGNDKMLSKISGIGAKKAEQMIVQLKHKVAKLLSSGVEFEGAEHIAELHNVTEVLQSLNYSRKEIDAAVNWLQDQNKGTVVPFDKMVRQALSFLAKKG
jgi:Holliday junction DNA helicase RuvA